MKQRHAKHACKALQPVYMPPCSNNSVFRGSVLVPELRVFNRYHSRVELLARFRHMSCVEDYVAEPELPHRVVPDHRLLATGKREAKVLPIWLIIMQHIINTLCLFIFREHVGCKVIVRIIDLCKHSRLMLSSHHFQGLLHIFTSINFETNRIARIFKVIGIALKSIDNAPCVVRVHGSVDCLFIKVRVDIFPCEILVSTRNFIVVAFPIYILEVALL